MNYKIVVFHPGQQHSFKVASAVKKNGHLLQYITSVYDKKSNLAMRLAHKIVRGGDSSKIGKRVNPDLLDDEVTTYNTFLSLVVIVLSRSKHTYRISIALDRWLADVIGKKAAKYAIKAKADAVICFSMNERVCFEYLKKKAPSIKRIVDCANSPVDFMRRIYENDMEQFNHSVLREEVPQFWNKKELQKQQAGINATSYFLAPSRFVKKGLMSCGVDEKEIYVVNYGSNFPVGIPQAKEPEQVRFIYVGQVTYRKGMHHLLKVFSSFTGVHLDIVGAWKPDSDLIREYGKVEHFTFHGQVPHERVKELMGQANVFVFDSLTEGFSLSCVEALSQGLPLLISENSGANDLVKSGVNGFVFDPENEDELRSKVQWFIDHKNRIVEMSHEAIDSAKECSWEQYGIRLSEALESIFGIEEPV